MIKVQLWGTLKRLADNQGEIEVDASNFKELLDQLTLLHPTLEPQIQRGVSLAVDGVIYREAWFTPLKAENEIVLLPYMTGG